MNETKHSKKNIDQLHEENNRKHQIYYKLQGKVYVEVAMKQRKKLVLPEKSLSVKRSAFSSQTFFVRKICRQDNFAVALTLCTYRYKEMGKDRLLLRIKVEVDFYLDVTAIIHVI